MTKTTYSEAIRLSFDYLLSKYPEVFAIGQGLWSPWYVGNTMNNLESTYGKHRLIDTPVSEAAVTASAIGASIAGMRPIVVHPRMDFMLYAFDPIINQAAKWAQIFSSQSKAPLTIRTIINRRGEQGAQHSQSLYHMLASVPGLRVVFPTCPQDAYDFLISAVLSDDPVIYIDDRSLYEESSYLNLIPTVHDLSNLGPKLLSQGDDVTIVTIGRGRLVAQEALSKCPDLKADVFDLRVLSPCDHTPIYDSVRKTQRLVVVDEAWGFCGLASEVISSVCCHTPQIHLKAPPLKYHLPHAAAPTSSKLEDHYYLNPTVLARLLKSLT